MFENILDESVQEDSNISLRMSPSASATLSQEAGLMLSRQHLAVSYTSHSALDNAPPHLEVSEVTDELNNAKFEVIDLPESLNVIPAKQPAYELVKRFFDLVVAAILLLALAPILIVVAACVLASSKGPVLFKQPRLGRNGKKFYCYKFRSMVADAETLLSTSPELASKYLEQGFKIKDDPRVTKIGAFLRKSSLDELPQLLNVLKGDMSMIGPRPIVPKELSKYGQYSNKLLTVVPGLSGMWQASGRSETTYTERVRMDMVYIDKRSIMLDFSLALRTVTSVVKGTGAH
jgi:lipopolysaccharide/colanic/teichoic acid biosynthesis glycosyltransferase